MINIHRDGHHSALGDISRFADWLKSTYPENILIPLRSGKKSPVRGHKGGSFTWSDWDVCMASVQGYTDFGLLLRTFIVVDADSAEVVE